MLLEYIRPSTGQMLSKTWREYHRDYDQRRILFHGIARLILSLARIPQKKIISLQFLDDYTIALMNQPLPCSIWILENNNAPRTI